MGEAIWDELTRNGYCLLKGVVEKEKCDEIADKFFDYMEYIQEDFKRDDKTTWTQDILPIRTRGLLQHYGVGVQEHAVMARMAVKPVFETLYPNEQLTCSFDGTSFAPRPKVFKFANLQDWKLKHLEVEKVHVDQTTKGCTSIQGGLALVDQGENCKVFVVVPGSHHIHEEIMKIRQKNKQEKSKALKKQRVELPLWDNEQWLIMDEEMEALLAEKGLKRVRVPMEKGDFVLWDSRCVHSSADFTKQCGQDDYRLQVFVSMAPRIKDPVAYEKEVEKRKKAFHDCRTSKHSARELRLFPKNPRAYVPDTRQLCTPRPAKDLTEEALKLHGLLKY